MDIYIEEKRLSIHHKMNVYNDSGEQIYEISGKPVSVGAKFYVNDMSGNELLYIHQKVLAMTPECVIEQNGEDIAVVKRKLGLHKNFDIHGLDWTIEGDLTGHEYKLLSADGQEVCAVSRAWMEWGDSYKVTLADPNNVVVCVAIVTILDIDEDQQQASEAGAAGGILGGLLKN